jgi:hypothetical protein
LTNSLSKRAQHYAWKVDRSLAAPLNTAALLLPTGNIVTADAPKAKAAAARFSPGVCAFTHIFLGVATVKITAVQGSDSF